MRYIVISHEPFLSKMRNYFYFDDFNGVNIKAEYWCVQKILGYSRDVQYLSRDAGPDATDFNSAETFNESLLSLSHDTLVCLELFFNKDTFFIFQVLQRKAICFFTIDYFRNQPIFTSTKGKLLRSLSQGDLKRIWGALSRRIESLFFSIYARYHGVYGNRICFLTGKLSNVSPPQKHTKYVSITHFDYATFLLAKSEGRLVANKYVVFIDVFLPYHPDIKRMGSSSMDPIQYFEKLNRFFAEIEEQSGLKVVIAAHPKAKYKNEFGNRQCFVGKTALLVQYAEAVFTHHSTAINFAVLAKKQVGLLFFEDFLVANYQNYVLKNIYDVMLGYQKELNCSLINVEHSFGLSSLEPVDEERYDHFIKSFLLAESFPKTNFQIILEELEKNNKAKIRGN